MVRKAIIKSSLSAHKTTGAVVCRSSVATRGYSQQQNGVLSRKERASIEASLTPTRPSQLKNAHLDNNQSDNTLRRSSIPLSHPQLPHMSNKLPHVYPTATSEYYSPPTTESHPHSLREPTHLTEKLDRKHFQYEYTNSALHSSLPGTSPLYLHPQNMNTQWETYNEAMKRKNDPNRSPGEQWRIPTYKRYKTQRKTDIFNLSNSNDSVIDALKYNNGPALVRLNGGEGDPRVLLFRKMERAVEAKAVNRAFALYGEFHARFPDEPRSTYMGNMLLELCQGQHPATIRFLMTNHFAWDVYSQDSEPILAPQNLETFRLAIAAFASSGFYQELERYFQYSWRFFGPDLVSYHILLRNVMSAPKGLFMKWFKQLFQTNMGNGGSRNPRKIQPTIETWKLLMLYQGGTGSYKNAMNIYNHLKAFHIFKHGWERIEKELTYTYNTAVIQSQTLTRSKRRRYEPLITDYYNTIQANTLPRFPESLLAENVAPTSEDMRKPATVRLYPTYSLPLTELMESAPHENNDLTKLNADKNMVFDIDFHLMCRDGFQSNPYQVISFFKKNVRYTTDPKEHHHTVIYANKILRALLKRDIRLGFKFVMQNYHLKNPKQMRLALEKILEDARWISRAPRGAKYEARSKKVNAYYAVRKRKLAAQGLLQSKYALSLLPPPSEREKLADHVEFAKIKPNDATFAMLLHQAYRVHRDLPKHMRAETAKRIDVQKKQIELELAQATDPSTIRKLNRDLVAVSAPVAVEGSPVVWTFLEELGCPSVMGARYTPLAGYFEKLYGAKPIVGAWLNASKLQEKEKNRIARKNKKSLRNQKRKQKRKAKMEQMMDTLKQ